MADGVVMTQKAKQQVSPCPKCGKDLNKYLVEPIYFDNSGGLEGMFVSCPNCQTGFKLSVREVAQMLTRHLSAHAITTALFLTLI